MNRTRDDLPDLGWCRDCHAEVLWVQTRNGSLLPLDPGSHPTGNVVPLYGRAMVLKRHEMEMETGPRWRTHFASCPGPMPHPRACQAVCKNGQPCPQMRLRLGEEERCAVHASLEDRRLNLERQEAERIVWRLGNIGAMFFGRSYRCPPELLAVLP